MLCALIALLQTSTLTIDTVRQLSYECNDGRVKLQRVRGTDALFFQSKMSCDVDGSPNAYHPWDDDLSLDVIGSAGGRRWDNLAAGRLEVLPSPDVVVYQNGAPYIQPDGEFKGFYVSETSYENPDLPATDPRRYLDARQIQYIVLPSGLVPEAAVGDLAIVYDPVSGRHVAAVFGDVGPSTESGEASLATIRRLGLPVTDGKWSPGQLRDDLFFLVFPRTGDELAHADAWPHAQGTIDSLAEAEFAKWGGVDRVKAVLQSAGAGGSLADTDVNRGIYDELAVLQSDGLASNYGFDLPKRCGAATCDRLPCAPEIVVACHAAILSAQRRIGKVERSGIRPKDFAKWRGHLAALAAIVRRFPVEMRDEVGPVEIEQARIAALLARIQDLSTRPGTK